MIRKAVERMSYLNIIHVGDILLVHQVSQQTVLQVEQNYRVNVPDLGSIHCAVTGTFSTSVDTVPEFVEEI